MTLKATEDAFPGRGRSLGGGLRGRLGCWRRRAVGWAPRTGQRTFDAGDTLRYGMQVTAQLAQLSDYAAMQGQDQRHQHSQQGHTDASYGDCLGTHGFTVPDWRSGVKPGVSPTLAAAVKTRRYGG